MLGFFNSKKPEVLHHWFTVADGFQTSPSEFYQAIEKALLDRKVPGLEIARVDFAEGGLLSAKREYLRLTRERLIIDICAAPFGTGFFFSSRMAELPLVTRPWEISVLFVGTFLIIELFGRMFGVFWGSIALLALLGFSLWLMRNTIALGLKDVDATLLKTPVISTLYQKYLRKETYYRQDTKLMYLQIVPAIVKSMAEEITAAKGIKLTQQFEHKPILKELYHPVFPQPGELKSNET